MLEEDQGYDVSLFKATYFEECAELLANAEEIIVRLRGGTGSSEDLHGLFRCVHSIKGGAGAFAFDGLVEFAHVFESSLEILRSGRIALTPQIADLLVRANDVLGDYVRAAQDGLDLPADHGREVMEQLAAITDEPSATAIAKTAEGKPLSETRRWLILLRPALGLLRSGNDPLLLIRELQTLGIVDIVPDVSRLPSLTQMDARDCYLSWTLTLDSDKPLAAIEDIFEFVTGHWADVVIEPMEENPSNPPPTDPTPHSPDKSDLFAKSDAPSQGPVHTASIRVDLDKIDRLVNMVGELVITQAMLGQQTSQFRPETHGSLLEGIEALAHHTRELQESVMAIRAQPVKAIFSRAPRLVRDLADKLEKQARLVMTGENTEVDKTVIERLSDPLTHLIRNALDHGIESADQRMALGKLPEGTIHLSAQHRSGRIVIEIADDGRGIDRERVLARAIEKGLVERGAHLSDEDIQALIFEPGFSTATDVSDISGRGVGMDVVRKNIEEVGGRVVVQSTPGQGSRFVLSLPLTLAVMDGMLVAVGTQRYVIALTNIVESLRPTPQQTRTLVNVGEVLEMRGDYIRLVRLHALFGVEGAITDPCRGLVVVVETEGRDRIGLMVDELLGQQQVVIKSLDANFRPVDGISAATILGDGKVALILDIGALRTLGEKLPPNKSPSVGERHAAK